MVRVLIEWTGWLDHHILLFEDSSNDKRLRTISINNNLTWESEWKQCESEWDLALTSSSIESIDSLVYIYGMDDNTQAVSIGLNEITR